MWTVILAVLIASPQAFASPTEQQVVYASCSCEVYNADGIAIQPREFTGSPLPAATGYFDVHGKAVLKSDYELRNCQETEAGSLSMACAVAAVKAQHNADFRCGEIARSYNGGNIRGFENGSVIPGSCILSLGTEDPEQEWSFLELLKNLYPF